MPGEPNSASTCRQPPQGEPGPSPATTAIASIERSPAATAATAATALRSAHTVGGYEAFSTFTPVNTRPPARTAAPTAYRLYGA